MTDHEAAWAAIHENTPEGWYVGKPGYEDRLNRWTMYAFDPSETPVVSKRSREWTSATAGGRSDGPGVTAATI